MVKTVGVGDAGGVVGTVALVVGVGDAGGMANFFAEATWNQEAGDRLLLLQLVGAMLVLFSFLHPFANQIYEHSVPYLH